MWAFETAVEFTCCCLVSAADIRISCEHWRLLVMLLCLSTEFRTSGLTLVKKLARIPSHKYKHLTFLLRLTLLLTSNSPPYIQPQISLLSDSHRRFSLFCTSPSNLQLHLHPNLILASNMAAIARLARSRLCVPLTRHSLHSGIPGWRLCREWVAFGGLRTCTATPVNSELVAKLQGSKLVVPGESLGGSTIHKASR